MNDELKTALRSQREMVSGAVLRYEDAKAKLEAFDAHSRKAIKGGDKPIGWAKSPTDDDTDALILTCGGRAPLEAALIASKAELESVKVNTQCLLAEVSLVCSETAAMSRIAGQ